MRLIVKDQIQVVRKSDTLPEAIGTNGSNIIFRVYVNVEAVAAVRNNVLLLEYDVSPVNVEKVANPNFSASSSKQIYQIPAIRAEKLKRDKDLVVYSGRVDITKYLPNDKLKDLQAGLPLKNSTVVRPSNSQKSIKPPLPRSSAVNDAVPTAFIAKKTYKTIAAYKGKDPAHELNSKPSHAPVSKIVSGFRTTGNYQKVDMHFEAARLEMQKIGAPSASLQRAELSVNFITVPLEIEIPDGSVRSYSVSVKALKNKVSVQRLDQVIDFSSSLKDAIVPSVAPKISITDNGIKRKISVEQIDPRASNLRIYRKILNKDSAVDDSYELIASLDAGSGDAFNILDTNSSLQQGIYRAISYDSTGRTIGEFSSASIGKSRISKQRRVEDPVTIFAYEISNGIQISAYNIPYGVVAIRILRKNLTIREKEFSTPDSIREEKQKKIDNETTSVSFVDLPLRPDSTFEYKVSLIDLRGNVYDSQRSSIVHYVGSKNIEESKSLIGQDYRIASDGNEKIVSFQIDVSSSKTTLDQVYEILSSTGLDAQYLDEIKSNRELLNKITALEIVRFDCSTGLTENFGVIKPGVFEDSPRTREVYKASSIIPGRKYVYFARLLVRSPSTIFNQTSVNRNDVETGKSFVTNLKKYNSPKTLRKGVLSSNVVQKRAVSITGLASDPSSSTTDEMIAGMTSTTISINVDVPAKDAEINNILVRKTQRGNEISWNIFSNDRKIDHVIVHADYNGRLAPLRAVHFDGDSKMMFLDESLSSEPTPVKYYVQVVYANYDMGSILGPARVK